MSSMSSKLLLLITILIRFQGDPSADYVINKDGVKLRQKKPPSGNSSTAGDEKFNEFMNRMKINDVPRYDYVEEDSVRVSFIK